MTTMNMDGQEQIGIFSMLAAILHLGNIKFELTGNDQSKVQNRPVLGEWSELTFRSNREATQHRSQEAGNGLLLQKLRSEQARIRLLEGALTKGSTISARCVGQGHILQVV